MRYSKYSGRTVTLETVLPEYSCYTTLHRFYITPVSIWALGPRFARLVAQRLLLWARPLFSIQRFQGGLRLWLRRPEKVGGWKRAGHAASAKSSLSLIKGWCRMWCQFIILPTYLFFLVLRIRCLHYKLRISHWELWSLHAISIRYVQHYHHRWSCWPWTPIRNLRLIYSW